MNFETYLLEMLGQYVIHTKSYRATRYTCCSNVARTNCFCLKYYTYMNLCMFTSIDVLYKDVNYQHVDGIATFHVICTMHILD